MVPARSRDRYGVLLLLIVASIFVFALDTETFGRAATTLRLIVLGSMFVFALYTSGARRRTYLVCLALVGAVLVLSVPFEATSRAGRTITSVAGVLLSVGTVAVIVRRFGTHLQVTARSILAAICAYLLVGLAFAALYGAIAAIGAGGLFAGPAGDGTNAERIYFSYVTLTTTGYGDLTIAGDPGRLTAVSEALFGQIYLVTIVALLVGNIGQTRSPLPRRGGPPAD